LAGVLALLTLKEIVFIVLGVTITRGEGSVASRNAGCAGVKRGAIYTGGLTGGTYLGIAFEEGVFAGAICVDISGGVRT
jgi:hypothetical protein